MSKNNEKAVRLALEALKDNQHLVADNERHAYVMEYNHIIEQLEEALAQSRSDVKQSTECIEQSEQDTLAYREAANLAKWLFKKHYAHEEHYTSGRVVWGLCDTTAGVISQIDNMVCKLVREQEQGERSDNEHLEEPRTWVKPHEWRGLTDEEIRSVEFDHIRRRDYARAIEAKLREKNSLLGEERMNVLNYILNLLLPKGTNK